MTLLRRIPEEDQLLDDFVRYLIDELSRSSRTAQSYLWSLKAVRKTTGRPLHKLSVEDLRTIKRNTSVSLSTRRGHLAACKRFHEWGALEGYWKLKPLQAVKGIPETRRPSPALGLPQARLLLGSCHHPLEYRVVFFGLYAGCRISESANMTLDNWRDDKLVFIGKGSKERTVPVHVDLARVKDIVFSCSPASVGVLHSSINRLRKRIGITDEAKRPLTGHTLRRTFALTLYERFKVPREVVATLLGHGSQVTDLYAPVRYQLLREAVDKLSYYSYERGSRVVIAEILANGGIKWNPDSGRYQLLTKA